MRFQQDLEKLTNLNVFRIKMYLYNPIYRSHSFLIIEKLNYCVYVYRYRLCYRQRIL